MNPESLKNQSAQKLPTLRARQTAVIIPNHPEILDEAIENDFQTKGNGLDKGCEEKFDPINLHLVGHGGLPTKHIHTFAPVGRTFETRVQSYDPDTRTIVLRTDNSNCLPFWLEIRVPLEQLEQVLGKYYDQQEDYQLPIPSHIKKTKM